MRACRLTLTPPLAGAVTRLPANLDAIFNPCGWLRPDLLVWAEKPKP